MSRQVDFDRGPLAHLGIDSDVPAGLLDEAVDLAEAEACTLADLLCSEERVEGLGDHLLRHSGAGVCNRDKQVLARQYARLGGGIALIKVGILRFDRKAPALRHSVARVDREVEKYVFELVLIGVDTPGAAGQYGLKLNMCANRMAKQV